MKMRTGALVMVCSLRCARRRAPARRGMSLIEGLVASVVLLIGLSGVFQSILVASQQNTLANLSSRGAGIASQMRMALEALGPDRVVGRNGILNAGNCLSLSAARGIAGEMDELEPGQGETWERKCIFDLDAYEQSQSGSGLLPGYPQADRERFRRVAVWIIVNDKESKTRVQQIAVVVSWNAAGFAKRFVKQYLNFYDAGPEGSVTRVEI